MIGPDHAEPPRSRYRAPSEEGNPPSGSPKPLLQKDEVAGKRALEA
jgi:hypothetical protein